MQKLKNIYFLIFFLAISTIANLDLILRHGVLGYRHDWNLPLDNEGLKQMFKSAFSYYNEYQMGITFFYPTDILFRLIFGSLGYLGISGALASKGLVVFTIGFSGYFMYLLIHHLSKKHINSALAGIFYMLTPVLYNKIVAGHIYYIVSYTIAPLFVLCLFLSIKHSVFSKRVMYLILAALLFTITGSQIQFFIMVTLISVCYFFTFKGKDRIRYFIHFFIIGITSILLSLPWMAFIFDASKFQQVASNAATYDWFKIQSTSLKEALSLSGYVSDYYAKFYNRPNIQAVLGGLLFVGLIISSIRSFGRDYVKPTLVFTLIGIIFVSGGNTIFEPIFKWMFFNFPLTTMFREVYHLMFVPAFGYAVLLGLTFDKFIFVAKNIKFNIGKVVVTLSVILTLGYGYFNNGLLQDIEGVTQNDDYQKLEEELEKTAITDRVLWYPFLQPMNSFASKRDGYDILNTYSIRPTFTQTAGLLDYQNHVGYFLYGNVFDNTAQPYLGNLFSIYNINDFIYRKDIQSTFKSYYSSIHQYPEIYAKWESKNVYNTLDSQVDISNYNNSEHFVHFKNTQKTEFIEAVNEPIIVSGGLDGITNSLSMPKKYNPYDGFFLSSFVSENTPKINSLLLNDGNWTDYALSKTKNKFYIYPSSFIRENANPENGWIDTFRWWWFHPSFASDTTNGAFTIKPEAEINGTYDLTKSGKYTVLTKVLSSPKGGEIELTINDKVKKLSTLSINENHLEWVKIGDYTFNEKKDIKFNIKNLSGQNGVMEFVLIPSSEWIKIQKETKSELNKKNLTIIYGSETKWNQFKLHIPIKKENAEYENTNKYKTTFEDGSLAVNAKFNSDGDEFTNISLPANFNLKEYPYFEMEYEIDNPNIQYIQIGFEMKNENGENQIYWGDPNIYNRNQKAGKNTFITNAYIPLSVLGNKVDYQVSKIHLLAHKSYGVYPNQLTEAPYKFVVKNIKFSAINGLVGKSNIQNFSKYQDFNSGYNIDVASKGEYQVFAQFSPEDKINLATYIDGKLHKISNKNNKDGWIDLGKVKLNEGKHTIEFISKENSIHSKRIVLRKISNEKNSNKNNKPTVTYEKISSTKYAVKTNSKEPFILNMKNNFDSKWILSENGKTTEPFSVNGYSNGYKISEGKQEFVIEHESQKIYSNFLYFVICLFVSMLLAALLLSLKKTTKQDTLEEVKIQVKEEAIEETIEELEKETKEIEKEKE